MRAPRPELRYNAITMWHLLAIAAAQANPMAEVVDFSTPRPVYGLVARSGPPGCGVHFEYEDRDSGWTRYRYGISLPAVLSHLPGPEYFVPPHDETPAGSHWECIGEAPSSRSILTRIGYAVPWRIVDGDGAVLTQFTLPWAIDGRPLALALDALDDYERGRAAPTCKPQPGLECWSAFDLWVYLEEWTAEHCVVPEEPDL